MPRSAGIARGFCSRITPARTLWPVLAGWSVLLQTLDDAIEGSSAHAVAESLPAPSSHLAASSLHLSHAPSDLPSPRPAILPSAHCPPQRSQIRLGFPPSTSTLDWPLDLVPSLIPTFAHTLSHHGVCNQVLRLQAA